MPREQAKIRVKSSTPKLPCTAFEELMLAQDSHDYPCNIYAHMELTGALDRDSFATAVRYMLERHPLMRARLMTKFGRSAWDIKPVASLPICWDDSAGESGTSDERIANTNCPTESQMDLHRGAGLEIKVVQRHSRKEGIPKTLVWIKMHHAIADGLGLINAIHDMWLEYHQLITGICLPRPRCCQELLPIRNRFISGFRRLRELVREQWVGLAGVRQFLTRNPVPMMITHPQAAQSRGPAEFSATTYWCTPELTQAVREAAKRRRTSLNDLLAAYVFLGCSEFRKGRAFQNSHDWLRMMVPISLRGFGELQHVPACNVVSSVFLDRNPDDIYDFDSLIESIHEEMELIKKNRLALMFIFSIWIRKLLTFRSRRIPLKKCQTTMVFSNLGKIFFRSPLLDPSKRLAPGGVIIDRFEIYAPLTPFMHTAFTALLYQDRLMLMLRFDARFISHGDADQLMKIITAQLEKYSPSEVTAS